MPGDIPKSMLNALPQKTKDDIVVYLVNNNKEKIIEIFEDLLKKQELELSIDGLELENDVSE